MIDEKVFKIDSCNKNETSGYSVESIHNDMRLDKALADMANELSRSRLKSLIVDGHVRVNGVVCRGASSKVREGDEILVDIPPPVSADPEPEDIPLNIVFEDEHLLVLNKPVGLVVHPGAGNQNGTLVNALLHYCAGELSGIGGVMRPGIVHRLDKDTSGLMLVAKSDRAHQGLAAQLEAREIKRHYRALVLGVPIPALGRVDFPLGRDRRNRIKMAVNASGKSAVTHYSVIETYRDEFSLVECRLQTGRTHQIRVHMGYIKHPLIGDPLYGPQRTAVQGALRRGGFAPDVVEHVMGFDRQALHAFSLEFVHPVSGDVMAFEEAPPADISNLLKLLD